MDTSTGAVSGKEAPTVERTDTLGAFGGDISHSDDKIGFGVVLGDILGGGGEIGVTKGGMNALTQAGKDIRDEIVIPKLQPPPPPPPPKLCSSEERC